MFVKEAKQQPVMVDWVERNPASGKTLTPRGFTIRRGKYVVPREIRADPGGNLLRALVLLALLPFETLQGFVEFPVALWDYRHDTLPAWKALTNPEEILDGEYEGSIEVSRSTERPSWFFGLRGMQESKVDFTLTDNADEGRAHCRVEYPIDWDSASKKDKEPREPLMIQKLKIAPNSVNFIKVETQKDKQTQQDKVILSTGKCISEWLLR